MIPRCDMREEGGGDWDLERGEVMKRAILVILAVCATAENIAGKHNAFV